MWMRSAIMRCSSATVALFPPVHACINMYTVCVHACVGVNGWVSTCGNAWMSTCVNGWVICDMNLC